MSKEHQPAAPDESVPPPPQPFIITARFPNESLAGRAYFGVQETLYQTPESALSVFRFQLSRVYHVAVLGEAPSEPLEQRLRRFLSAGEIVDLPEQLRDILFERRARATAQGNWVEGHYRPGVRIDR